MGREEKLEEVQDNQIGRCKYCDESIAWLESKKTPGKKYPVNIKSIPGEPIVVNRYDFHNCDSRKVA
jgi:hypothetical protein